GLPHASIPAGKSEKEKMPIGLMLTAAHLKEKELLQASAILEKVMS
ncbi:MAG: hypothetical protein QT12_C0009G0011, partial [archaeon GW2011_AR21]